MPELTTADMLACARREVRMRQRVYLRWVSEGRMTAEKAQHEIACMQGIVALLAPMVEAEKPQGRLL